LKVALSIEAQSFGVALLARSPNCSDKIEFSFLNGNLMVRAGPPTIFNSAVMFVEANSIDGGVTLHQPIEPDTVVLLKCNHASRT